MSHGETVEPPLAPIALHPSELIKDPFTYRGKRIRFDVTEYPVLFDNNLISYMTYDGPPGILEQIIPRGLKFKKMFSPTDQLYDVMAVSQGGILSRGTEHNDVISLGELLVKVPSGQAELDTKRPWIVEPLGTVEGTNGFGAAISVPTVRFSTYWVPPQQLQQPPTQLEGAAQLAVDLVRGHIKPTEALITLGPNFEDWSWSSYSNGQCDGCLHVTGRLRVATSDAINPAYSSNGQQNYIVEDWDVDLGAKTVRIARTFRGDIPVPDSEQVPSKYFDIVK
jgi:hypothetical protein